MEWKILVTLPMTDADRRFLEERGKDCALRIATPAGADASDLRWADMVLGNLKPPEALERYPGICWLHTPNVGLDAYAALAQSRPDLRITNKRGIADHPVSEHVLALLFALTRALPRLLRAERERDWAERDSYGEHCTTLAGKRVQLLGYGSIARCLIGKLAGLSMDVTVYRRSAEGDDPRVSRFAALSDLSDMAGEADVVINLLPAVPDTRRIVGAEVFGAMRPDAFFINAGRGATVDEAAMVAALSEGRLRGAALDVFASEPLPEGSPLWTLPNVLVSPHVAGRFDGEMREQIAYFFDQLAASSSKSGHADH